MKHLSRHELFAGVGPQAFFLSRKAHRRKVLQSAAIRGLVAAMVVSGRLVPAQEVLRYSLAGDAAAESRARQAESIPYTVKWGDFRLLLTPSLGLDWNDNVNTSDQDAQQDFILKPMLQLNASYPITQRNHLKVNVGIGYDYYFDHNEYSGLRLSSGSEISFDTYVKDFWFNFHDRFEFSQDSAGQSAVANTAQYGGFENTAGLTTTWDLQDVVLTLGYDHYNFIASSSEYTYTDRAAEIIMTRAGFRIHPRLTTGVEGSFSPSRYNENILNDSTSYSGGVYAEWRPGDYISIQPRAGYAFYDFDQTSQFIKAVDQDGMYADLTLTHQVSEAISYSLSAGREFRLGGETADIIEEWYVRPSVNWMVINNLRLNLFFSYENGTQGTAEQGAGLVEDYEWFNTGLGLSYPLMKKLTGSLSYRLTLRSSDTSGRDYTQNMIGLLLTYHPK